jgi:NAD(P) transhydrogenase subunit alpha
MAINFGALRETYSGERRVALTPKACERLLKLKADVLVERSAGVEAGFPDEEYARRGVRVVSREEILRTADVIVQVRTPGANPVEGHEDIGWLRERQLLIGFAEPFTATQQTRRIAASGASLIAMELIPRITRAQGMDALSSQATIAGYESVLIAAGAMRKIFPMLMTAAGTITPAKVLVLGAGVAGLQAIATARRLGALASGYDLRPAVKEQVESLGAKFVVLEIDSRDSQDKGGYAKAMDENFYRRQRELLGDVIRQQDAVITTAAVPGKKAPTLITREMVELMAPGSVIVDIVAERGGNCELTEPGKTVTHRGVSILGPVNVASMAPMDASQMYATNVTNLIQILIRDGALTLDTEDEIVRETLVTHGGAVVNAKIREAMEAAPMAKASGGSVNV